MKKFTKVALLSIACLFVSTDAFGRTARQRMAARRQARQQRRAATTKRIQRNIGHTYTFSNTLNVPVKVVSPCRGANCPSFIIPARGTYKFRPIETEGGLRRTGVCLQKHSLTVEFPNNKELLPGSYPLVFVPTEGYQKMQQTIQQGVDASLNVAGEVVKLGVSAATGTPDVVGQAQGIAGGAAGAKAEAEGEDGAEVKKLVLSQGAIDKISSNLSSMVGPITYWNLINMCRSRNLMFVPTDAGYAFIVHP